MTAYPLTPKSPHVCLPDRPAEAHETAYVCCRLCGRVLKATPRAYVAQSRNTLLAALAAAGIKQRPLASGEAQWPAATEGVA